MLDFIRIACAVPKVTVGDVEKNAKDICAFMEKADAQNVDILLLPELALTGYTCGDLFFQDALHRAVSKGLATLLDCSKEHPELTTVVGAPLRLGPKIYNCAFVIEKGDIRGIVPKTYIPGNEKRWFASGADVHFTVEPQELGLAEETEIYADVQAQCLFYKADTAYAIEICHDLMTPMAPSAKLAAAGAEIILNLSASNASAGKATERRDRVKNQSLSCDCIYAYASAGSTESTSDAVYSGHSMIAQCGKLLAESDTPVTTDYMLITDCDLGCVRTKRRRNEAYFCATEAQMSTICTQDEDLRSDGSLYPLNKLPFVPPTREARVERCLEIFNIQVAGLMRRLEVINTNAVIGISGGLDSTLALLVAVEAMCRLGRPLTDVYGITMPCFGTSDRTYQNAWELMRKLGISAKEINIKNAVAQHFSDIGHDPDVHNATYENAQARERTQILMDYAGEVGGIVVGTGDLSELALGWCTYNGDHMSMYSVNGTVPKTLIRWIIEAVSDLPTFAPAKEVLMDVLDTPISPELLPPDAQGKIAQKTEDLVGPYALHDFFIYYAIGYGYTPTKIFALACRAFEKDFDAQTVKKWLVSFYRRFFSQQFKRNCQPDGVKTGSIGFGPRTDWHMPSDAAAKLWLDEAQSL